MLEYERKKLHKKRRHFGKICVFKDLKSLTFADSPTFITKQKLGLSVASPPMKNVGLTQKKSASNLFSCRFLEESD